MPRNADLIKRLLIKLIGYKLEELIGYKLEDWKIGRVEDASCHSVLNRTLILETR